MRNLQVAGGGKENLEMEGKWDISQVMLRMRAGTYDVFEVVFYPALASHGDDDFDDMLWSEHVRSG